MSDINQLIGLIMHPLSPKTPGEEGSPSYKILIQNDPNPLESKTHDISKKTIKAHEAVNKSLKKFQESPDEPDFTAEQIEILSHALDRFIKPVSKNSLFYDTDLIIIDESFKGHLPLNGIKQSELNRIEKLFNSICDGKEKFQILVGGTNDPFKAEVERLIKKLLTRNIGRKLIRSILRNSSLTKVEIVAGEICKIKTDPIKNIVTIVLGGKSKRTFAIHPTGQLKTQSCPRLIEFLHELVHASHFPNLLTDFDPTFSHQYSNLEEQWTITGFKKDCLIDRNKNDISSWKPSPISISALKKHYNELNEWNITAAFTDSQNVYYPRFGHNGINFNPLRMTKEEAKELKANGQYEEKMLEQQRIVIEELLRNGALFDLKNMKNVDLHKLFEKSSISPLFFAVTSGRVDMVEYLVDKGFDLHATVEGINALLFILANTETKNLPEYYELIRFLIEKNINLNPSITYLIETVDLKILNEAQFKPLMQMMFMGYAKDYKISSLFLSKIKKPHVDKQLLGTLISDCACDNLHKFLAKTHKIHEIQAEYKYYSDLADVLYNKDIDTEDLDDLLDTLKKIIKNDLKQFG